VFTHYNFKGHFVEVLPICWYFQFGGLSETEMVVHWVVGKFTLRIYWVLQLVQGLTIILEIQNVFTSLK
jgi:hypothetical protein